MSLEQSQQTRDSESMNIIPLKRMSKITGKFSFALTDNGVRITFINKKIGKMAQKLRVHHEQLQNDGSYVTGEFERLMRALNYYYSDYPTLVTNSIPNLIFLRSNDEVNEIEINGVFVNEIITEWIELFQIFLKLIKKYTKRFDLL